MASLGTQPIKIRSISIFLLISLSLCHIWISAGQGQNAYNFVCDRTPQQHDWILRNAIMNLEKGDTCIIMHNLATSIMLYVTPYKP